MPDTKNGYFDFSDAPNSGESLDDIFASTENTPVAPQQIDQPQEPVTPTTPEPFLKTATGTVYNTVDDAITGVEHKDALITQLRQELLQATNVDPLKKKPEPQTVDPNLVSYIDNPKQYFADIKKAQTEEEVLRIQQRFVNEQLAPYAPVIASVVKSQAVDSIVSEIPTFRTFLGSQEYKDTLESFPLLKQGIQFSETNPNMAGDLVQLYRMAYDASAGRNMPKTVQASTITTPAATARPTVSSTPVTPPPTSSQTAPPSFGNTAGRKAIIEQQEAAGAANLRF